MPEPTAPADEAALQRRRFLRGGALMAAAAGGAVAASAGSVLPAQAAPAYLTSITIAVPAMRLLDTRTAEGRKAIVASSASALDSKGRLKKGAWIDVALVPTEDDAELSLFSVFLNLTSSGSTKGGSLVVGVPGNKPTGRTLSFDKGRTVTVGTIAPLAESGDYLVVRVFAAATGHVRVDVTGASIVYDPSTDGPVFRKAAVPAGERLVKAVRAARG